MTHHRIKPDTNASPCDNAPKVRSDQVKGGSPDPRAAASLSAQPNPRRGMPTLALVRASAAKSGRSLNPVDESALAVCVNRAIHCG